MSGLLTARKVALLCVGLGECVTAFANAYYPNAPEPTGETMSAFKKRRRSRRLSEKAVAAVPEVGVVKDGAPTSERTAHAAGSSDYGKGVRVRGGDVPPALRQLYHNKIVTSAEVRAAACLARDYDMGFRSSVRITRYEEYIHGGGNGAGDVHADILDARARYEAVRGCVDERLWVYVYAVVIEKVERVKVAGVADRFGNEKLRRAASAVALVTGLGSAVDWYRANGWGPGG